MRSHESPRQGDGERGFTLIELVVLVAIVAIVGGLAFEALAQRPAAARTTAISFAALVAEARALAAVNGGSGPGAGSGASIGVVRDGADYVATVSAYRPIAGAPVPAATWDEPSLRTTTAIVLIDGTTRREPPFALFFAASGHVSARPAYTLGRDAPLAAEPACPLETGITIAFLDGVHDQTYAISCEMARLDLTARHS